MQRFGAILSKWNLHVFIFDWDDCISSNAKIFHKCEIFDFFDSFIRKWWAKWCGSAINLEIPKRGSRAIEKIMKDNKSFLRMPKQSRWELGEIRTKCRKAKPCLRFLTIDYHLQNLDNVKCAGSGLTSWMKFASFILIDWRLKPICMLNSG